MSKGKKYTYKEVKNYVEILGYELISKEYKNCDSKLLLKDKEGYYYLVRFGSLKQNKKPSFVESNNPYTIKNIKLWLKLNDKQFELVSDKYEGSNKKLKWQCLKEDCGEIFEMCWGNISQNQNCPYCRGLKVGLSNCLAIKNPELTKEWHSILNGDLTPYDVTCSSNKSVWWQCKDNPEHKWKALICNRNNFNNNCPYCCGRYASKENNLLISNPLLCKEWNYDKNKKSPYEYTPNSKKKVWWVCKKCNHEWEAIIYSRNSNGQGCPECSKSKGEKECQRVLISKNIFEISQNNFEKLIKNNKNKCTYFIPQMKFNNLIGIGGGLLSYDFYLPQYSLLIEYDGEFHYKPIKNYKNEPMKYAEERLKKQQEHDRLKNEYAHVNNIKLLRIPYWEFYNIESILTETLKDVSFLM